MKTDFTSKSGKKECALCNKCRHQRRYLEEHEDPKILADDPKIHS